MTEFLYPCAASMTYAPSNSPEHVSCPRCGRKVSVVRSAYGDRIDDHGVIL